jgi:hypothetical protein
MKRHGLLLLLAGGLCASAALAVDYYWIAEGEDLCWTTEDNWDWDHSVNAYYPGANDIATIGDTGGSWTVGLETGDVARLQVSADTTFQACEQSPILTADVVRFLAPSSGGNYVTIEVTGGRIMTN